MEFVLAFMVGAAVAAAVVHFISRAKLRKAQSDLTESSSQLKEICNALALKENKIAEIEEDLERKSILQKQVEDDFNLYKQEVAKQFGTVEANLESANSAKNEVLSEKQSLLKKIEVLEAEKSSLKENGAAAASKIASLEDTKKSLEASFQQRINTLQGKIDELTSDKLRISNELSSLQEQEPIRQREYDHRLQVYNKAMENHEKTIQEEKAEKEALEAQRLEELKQTWANHEKDVEQKMRLICQQEVLEYVDKDKYPYAGKPDNSVKICDEYIIFDSKSPQGEDLSNFPNYIKNQADNAKKYAKNDGVRKEIFLVVPTNAIHTIKDTYLNLGNYCVHVITVDSLRPILLQLKKIEGYEFAESLSPEDRENIARVIGRMARGMKRRVQINQFLDKEYISTLIEAEKLPEEILEVAQKIERGTKLNPPMASRGKHIEVEDLAKENDKLVSKIIGQEITVGEELRVIDAIPLHQISSSSALPSTSLPEE